MGTSGRTSIRYLSALILGVIGVFPVLVSYTVLTNTLVIIAHTENSQDMSAVYIPAGLTFALGILIAISSTLIKGSSKTIRRFFLVLGVIAGMIAVFAAYKYIGLTGTFVIGSLLYLLPCIYIAVKYMRRKKKRV